MWCFKPQWVRMCPSRGGAQEEGAERMHRGPWPAGRMCLLALLPGGRPRWLRTGLEPQPRRACGGAGYVPSVPRELGGHAGRGLRDIPWRCVLHRGGDPAFTVVVPVRPAGSHPPRERAGLLGSRFLPIPVLGNQGSSSPVSLLGGPLGPQEAGSVEDRSTSRELPLSSARRGGCPPSRTPPVHPLPRVTQEGGTGPSTARSGCRDPLLALERPLSHK